MSYLKRIAILDVYSLLYRAFFAIPLLSVNNIPVNAIFGFIRILLKIYKDFNIDYLVSCIDKGKSGRNIIYNEYKSKRLPATDLFKQQIPILYEFYRESNLKLLYKEGFEADDIIYTVIHKFIEQNLNENNFIFIITGDTDLLQLINKNIFVVILKKGISEYVLFDKQKFYNEYGFDSTYYLLYKVLVGDNSDNIKGIDTIGPKKAQNFIKKLTNYFTNFEFTEENIDFISSLLLNSFKLNLTQDKIKEIIKLNYELLKLKFINELEDFNLEELKIKDSLINNGFINFLKKYNFKSILQELKNDFNKGLDNFEILQKDNKEKQLRLF
ncbi:MAG: 5'-3' exonuclease [bacterium]